MTDVDALLGDAGDIILETEAMEEWAFMEEFASGDDYIEATQKLAADLDQEEAD